MSSLFIVISLCYNDLVNTTYSHKNTLNSVVFLAVLQLYSAKDPGGDFGKVLRKRRFEDSAMEISSLHMITLQGWCGLLDMSHVL